MCALFRVICLLMLSFTFANAQNSIAKTKLFQDDLRALGFDWQLTAAARTDMNDGIQLLRDKKFRGALNKFEEVIIADSTCVPAWYYRTICKNNINGVSRTLVDGIKTVVVRGPFDRLWDMLAFSDSDVDFSGPVYNLPMQIRNMIGFEALKLHHREDSAALLLKESISFFLVGKVLPAFDRANRAAKISPTAELFYLKALLYRAVDKQDSAFFYYVRTAHRNSDIFDVHMNLAIYLSAANDFDGAVSHVKHLARLQPDSKGLSKFSGIIRMSARDYDGALADFDRHLEGNPNDFDCMKQKAVVRFMQRDYMKTVFEMDRLVKLTPNDFDVHFYKSEAYMMLGDTANSLKTLEDARKIFQLDPRLELLIAEKLIVTGELNEAQRLLRQTLRYIRVNTFNTEINRHANFLLCTTYMKKGKYEDALELINNIILEGGKEDRYLFTRAKLYVALNVKDFARPDLMKLKEKNYQPAIDLWKELKF